MPWRRAASVALLCGAAVSILRSQTPRPPFVFTFPLGNVYARSIAVDGTGNSYIAGTTTGLTANVPATAGAAQDFGSIFVTKIDPSGQRIIWTTRLGGRTNRNWYWRWTEPMDSPSGVAVDAQQNVYVAGTTAAKDFPVVNAVQSSPQAASGVDGFLVKLSADGSRILFSTYLGSPDGATAARALATDVIGNAYVGLWFSNANARLPLETSSLSPAGRPGGILVTKINAAGGIVYGTRFGSSGGDNITDLVADASGAVHVIGVAGAPDFPLVNPIVSRCRTSNGFCSAAFVATLAATGSRLTYSTFLAGDSGQASFTSVAADSSGATYIAGAAGPDYPVRDAYQATHSGGSDYVLTKLTPAGQIAAATFLGGDGDEGRAIMLPRVLLDAAGRPTIAGETTSRDGMVNDLVHPDVPLYASNDGGVSWGPSAVGLRSGVSTLAATESGAEIFYAGATDGIYKSTDSGQTWTHASNGLTAGAEATTNLAVDPAHPGTLYAGTRGGTFKSEDGAETWVKVDSGMFFGTNPLIGLAVDGEGIVFLGTEGVRRSRDGGRTWIDSSSGFRIYTTGTAPHYGAIGPIVFDPNTRGTIYAVQGDALYRSQNGGDSWSPVASNRFVTFGSGRTLTLVPGRARRLFASILNEVMRSDDDGFSWNGLGLRVGPKQILLKPRQPDTVYLFGGYGLAPLYVSSDAGSTWTPVTTDVLKSRIGALSFDPRRPNRLFGLGGVRSLPFVAGFNTSLSAVNSSRFVTVDVSRPDSTIGLVNAAMDPAGGLYLLINADYRLSLVKVVAR
jgi:hypothetical protein